jgi:hypothetical protein
MNITNIDRQSDKMNTCEAEVNYPVQTPRALKNASSTLSTAPRHGRQKTDARCSAVMSSLLLIKLL